MAEIPKKYKHLEIEKKWRGQWEGLGIYRFDPARNRRETFVVDTPPPTVSGSLHIGHVFSYTHQDLIVRYQRMLGKNIHYGMGWDDNGLPTERRVQNVYGIRCNARLPYDAQWKPQPRKKKAPIREVSRRNFIEACEILTAEDEKAFEELWRRLALSIDWTETYQTIDRWCRRVSQQSFLDLVEKGLVYHSDAPTMWDVDFKTAVAQAEVEDRERPGFMSEVRFGVEGGGELRIATTRPELLGACIAVVAHPDDSRYRELFGKTAITPIYGAKVPILAAEHADPEKGTGILMVCTFGDAHDVHWWKQSGLPLKQVIGMDGCILPLPLGEAPFESVNSEAAAAQHRQIAGLSAWKAKLKVLEILAQEGTGPGGAGAALVGEPVKISHPVRFYEKGDRPLEYIPTRQWFVKLLEHKAELVEQGQKIQWHPEMMRIRYQRWVEGLNQDWCISRQRYFGVPFPVWYPVREDGAIDYEAPIYASVKSLPIDPLEQVAPGYEKEERDRPGGFTGDPDVMDTWATSSLTPQIQSRWGSEPQRHEKLFPMDIRPQAHEIIRTWAFYTIVKAWMHEGEIPWKHAVISGWILDPDRKKMSKSKGNVVTPVKLLERYSVDAVRYWAARARLGTDTTYDEKVFKVGKRLTTKIFNACRFVAMQLGRVGADREHPCAEQISHPLDLAVVDYLAGAIVLATEAFESFEYAVALQRAEEAFWAFCDHYVELAKLRSYSDDPGPERDSAIATLHFGMSALLRLLAPILPYVTEECWSWWLARAGREASIHTSPWPQRSEFAAAGAEAGAARAFTAAVAVMTEIRGAKSRARKTLKWPVAKLEVMGSAEKIEALRRVLDDVGRAGWVEAGGMDLMEGAPPEGQDFAVTVTLADPVEE